MVTVGQGARKHHAQSIKYQQPTLTKEGTRIGKVYERHCEVTSSLLYYLISGASCPALMGLADPARAEPDGPACPVLPLTPAGTQHAQDRG